MTVTFDQALKLIGDRCRLVTGRETVALSACDGRILGQDVVAPISVPPADNSAVDGYAFRHTDLPASGNGRFEMIGVAAAGRPFAGSVGPGQAVRIFTGALPPAGCDTVAMQEDVAVQGERVTIPAGIAPNANVRRAGEDIPAGTAMLASGRRIGPREIGLLASAGFSAVAVRKPLRVAVFSSGDELVQPVRALGAGEIYDTNRPMLLAMLGRMGIDAVDRGVLPDGADAIRAALADAVKGHDAIVTSAGVSVGDEDHIRAAVMALGGLDFQGVALKPGRPMTAGHVAGVPFFGLPGNPVAMTVNFLMLARSGLLALAGAEVSPPRRIPVTLGAPVHSKLGRRDFLRASLVMRDGVLVGAASARGGSGILSSLADCDGLIELDETAGEVAVGTQVPFIPLSELGL